jgi:membrane protease YdiL (CAAX protease family)
MEFHKSVFTYTSLLVLWTWLGGWVLHSKLEQQGIGLFFILSPFLLTILFILLSNDTLKDIGVKFTHDTLILTKYLRYVLEYFFFLTIVVFLGEYFILNFRLTVEDIDQFLIILIPVSIIIIIQALFEEIAWSGWLYYKFSNFDYYFRVFLISVIWIIWHLPFFFWTDQLITLDSIEPMNIVIIILQLVVSRYLYSWFRWRSDNIWWPTIIHGVSNISGFILGSILMITDTSSTYVLIFVIIANLIYCIRLYYFERRTNSEQEFTSSNTSR